METIVDGKGCLQDNHNLYTSENCSSGVPLQDMSWMNVWDFQKKNRERWTYS